MEVWFKKSFTKQYLKLQKSLQVKCDERLLLFKSNRSHPLLDDHPLHGEWMGHRSINVTGDYRALYFEEGMSAWFVAVGTHHELFGT